MERVRREGGNVFQTVVLNPEGPRTLSKNAAILSGFFFFQVVQVGLIKDNKIGAGKIRAAKIQQVLSWGISQ